MSPLHRDVSATELELLKGLWEAGPLMIRDLAESLYPGGSTSKYATVQRLLDRLEAKGFVARDRAQRAHTFRACVPREEFIGNRLREMAERLCAGSLTPLLSELVRSRPLGESERAELIRLIEEAGEGESA